jgi:REP element-mobilizing transposase RayT
MTAASRCQEDRDIDLICATVMPDHVHMLFHLGERIALDRVVAKVKGLSSSALLSAGGRWQENFYEHRLRPDESQTPFIRYVFMNPYRSRLVGLRGEWPYWMSGRGSESLIGELDEGRYPPSEWLNESQELPEDLIGKD